LVLVGVDSVVRWYRTTTQQITGRVPLPHPDMPFAVDGMGTYLANARPDQGIDLIRVADNVMVATLPTERRVTQIVFHPTEPLLVVAEGDTVSFWDTTTLEEIHELASDTPSTMVFSQRGTRLAKAEVGPGLRAASFESRITILDVVARTTALKTTYVVADLISAVAFRPDGRRLAVGGGYPPSVLVGEWPWMRRRITVVDTERNDTIVDRIQTPFRAIIDIAYASDTMIMVFGANADQEEQVCVWDVR
jgi:WD40 repeat protein